MSQSAGISATSHDLLLIHLQLRYNFFKQKSGNLAIISQSAGILAALHGMSVSQPATRTSQLLQAKNAKMIKDVSNKKFLLLANLLLYYNFFMWKSNNSMRIHVISHISVKINNSCKYTLCIIFRVRNVI